MSVWQRAQELPEDRLRQVQAIYGDHFPIEVRHYLAAWIESKLWNEMQEDRLPYFVEELAMQIEMTAEQMVRTENFLHKVKLIEAAKIIRQRYCHSPRELLAMLQHCLQRELEVIQSSVGHILLQPLAERKYSELITGLQEVRQKVVGVAEEVRGFESSVESFSLQYHECAKIKGHASFLMQSPQMTPEHRELDMRLRHQISEVETKMNLLGSHIEHTQLNLTDRLMENIKHLEILQKQVLEDELIKWKREQQLYGNGVPMNSNLNTIQDWCEQLADLIWTTRQQVNDVARILSKTRPELRQQHVVEGLDKMSKMVTSLLSTLVTSTFVIEKQPPQVMKTNTRFTATVRLLVGGQLNVHMTPPKVSVMIISEQQAQLLLKTEPSGRSKPPQECGDILNNTGSMEYQIASRQLSVSFRNMQLRKIKRAEKKGTESVMDEKLTLLFQSDFNVGGGELVFQVWTLSLPVVVIVHGNQEPHGWATVTWDNAFSPSGRIPFAVPDKVTWGELAETLRIKFCSAIGGNLSQENLHFLAEKIFKCSLTMPPEELNAMGVTWAFFCKDALPERTFTFWEWFYNVVKLTRDQLKNLWCDNLIMGFIQKKQAEEMLSKCRAGTFLLRYSDSEQGAITIACTGENQEVFSLQPFTAKDLQLRSLADRVLDLPQLQYLYPNTPKNDVFAKYYTKQENELKNGYVKPTLVTTLPSHLISSPAYSAHSPDSHRNTPSVQSIYSSTQCDMQSFMDSRDLMDQLVNFDHEFEDLDFEQNVQ